MKPLSVRRREPAGTRRFKKRPRPTQDNWFALYVELLRAYVGRHGHARVPSSHREGNFCLGGWVGHCRRRYRDEALSPEQVHMLERFHGWTWDPIEDRFRHALRLVWRFARRKGHARVPYGHREEGFPLGAWVATRRQDYKHGRISRLRVAALEAMPGWSWRPHEDDFHEGLRLTRRFAAREGHAHVPDRHEEAGFPLGSWVRCRRKEYRDGTLSTRRMRLLQRLPGWTWDHWGKQFEAGLRRLKRFVWREGHALVPARHREGAFPLGSWVNNRRAHFRRGILPPKRARALDAIPGWRWRLRAPRRRKATR